MAQLVAALFDFLVRLQEAIHGPDGAKVLAFVQKGRVDLLGGLIHELLRVEHIQDLLTFLETQGTGRERDVFGRLGLRSLPPALR